MGFFTREIRARGERVGFAIHTLDGREGILAHRDIGSSHRVGRYGVNLRDLEEIAVPAMTPMTKGMLVVIDEIGKMECLSALFREMLVRTLDSNNPVLGTIALKGNRFVEQIKKRPDVRLILVSVANRDRLAGLSFDEVLNGKMQVLR